MQVFRLIQMSDQRYASNERFDLINWVLMQVHPANPTVRSTAVE